MMASTSASTSVADSTPEMVQRWRLWALPLVSESRPTVIPYLGSDDHNERILAKWYKKIQGRFQRKTLQDEDIMRFEELPGWTWGKNRDAEFGKKAQAWVRFVRTQGRVPRKTNDASHEEKILAAWASRVQRAKNKGALPEQQVIQLDKTQGWTWKKSSGPHTSFATRLQEWKAFVNEHGRQPQKGEGPLFQWRQRLMNDYLGGKLTQERQAVLSELEGWTWDEPNDILRQARKWAAWVRTNEGTFPSPDATTNEVEKRLGNFAVQVRNGIFDGTLPEDIKAQIPSISSYWVKFLELSQQQYMAAAAAHQHQFHHQHNMTLPEIVEYKESRRS
jgi:hypothetical protein